MKERLKENKFYELKVNIFGRIEQYIGKIQSIKNNEIRLETEDDNLHRALTLKQKNIIYAKEISQPQKEGKIHKISNKKKFTNLKESPKPQF